jgi:uncharacterized protein YdeI (YjbR/CyaY-like superfamily)
MAGKPIETLEVGSREEWRKWLEGHYDSTSEIWLVFYKRHTGVATMSYDDAVEEAICFGWIDSIVRRLDENRYARKFTPRRADSKWSTINRRRYRSLKARGLLEEPGLRRAPTGRSGDAPKVSALPAYIKDRLKSVPGAWEFFQGLAPSYQRAYVAWIESAKREATKEKRLREAAASLAAGKKLGLK